MGANMARRLLRGGHEVVAYDPSEEAVSAVASEGAVGVRSLEEAKKMLEQSGQVPKKMVVHRCL